MASVKPLTVQFSVDASGAVEGLKVAAQGVDGAAQSMRLSLGNIGSGARELTQPFEDITHHIRGMRQEMFLGSFMARQIGELGIASKESAGMVAGLAGAFLVGNWTGLAVEGVLKLTGVLNKMGAESTKAAADAIRSIDALHTKVEDYLASLRNETEVEKMRRTVLAPLEEKEAAQKSELVALTDDLATRTSALRKSQSSGMDLLSEKGRVEALKRQIEEKEKLLALTEIEANAARKAIKEAGDAKAGVDQKANLEQAAIEAAQWRASEMQEWKKHYDAITAALAKSLQEQDDLENKNAIDMAKFRAEQFQEDRKHYKEVEAETLKSLQAEQAAEDAASLKRAQTLKRVSDQIASSATSSLRAIVDGSQSAGEAIKSLFENIAFEVIGTLIRLGIESIAMSIAGATAAKTAAVSTTQGHIAEAIAGAAASQAFIPIIGPGLAAKEAAAMAILLEGITAPMLAAEGGFDVPAGMSPITRLHEKEMVLPRQLAEGVRAMVANGGSGGGVINLHFPNALFVDRASLEKLPQDPNFIRGMREARRNRQIP